jgi:cation transport ATPase
VAVIPRQVRKRGLYAPYPEFPSLEPGDANQARSSDRHGVARCVIVWQKIPGPADTLKPSARAAVEALHAMGLEVAMITGDHAHTAAIAEQVGIDRVLAEVLPHEKAAKGKEL